MKENETKVKVAGIVAEYNPFHNGHLYHIEETRRVTGAEIIVAVMSGNFLQRGEAALWDKWIRAEAAIKNGVDIVLELPVLYACNNAEHFARGAVGILDRLGCITHLSFGSEDLAAEDLTACAKHLLYEDEAFQSAMKDAGRTGSSVAKNKYEALKQSQGSELASVIAKPNHILGVEYVKALLQRKSMILPVSIMRKDAQYNDIQIKGDIVSATAIRKALGQGRSLQELENVMPQATSNVLESIAAGKIRTSRDFYEMIAYEILRSSEEELSEIFSVREGLENRIKRKVYLSGDLEELIDLVKSKRYTRTRVQRVMMHILLGIKRDMVINALKEDVLYARLLGASKNGSAYLKTIKKSESCKLTILTNLNKEEALLTSQEKELLALDKTASHIYHLPGAGAGIWEESEYKKYPYIEKK